MSHKPWLEAYSPGVPAEIDPDRYPSLVALLESSFARYAAQPAFTNLGTTITFADVERLSRAFAAYLQSLPGMQAGERVAIMVPNTLQSPVVLFGILRAGFVVVNVNPMYTVPELTHQLVDSGARAIVVLENFAHTVAAALPSTKVEDGDRHAARRSLRAAETRRRELRRQAREEARAAMADSGRRGLSRRARARRGAALIRRRALEGRRPRIPAIHGRHHGARERRHADAAEHGGEHAAGRGMGRALLRRPMPASS